MYQCKECQKPITEFDAIFYKTFYNVASMSYCRCYGCMTKGLLGEVIKRHEDFKKYSWLCWMTFVSLIITVSGFLAMLLFDFVFFASIIVVGVYSFIGFWISGAIKTIKGFNLDLGSVKVGSHYETTYNSSNGSFTTKSVSDYYDGEDGGKAFWLGITYPFWCLPYFIYRNVKYTKICPKEARKAYKAAREQARGIMLSKSFLKSRDDDIEKYNRKVSNIKNTYALMGEEVINRKLRKVIEPKYIIFMDKKTYYIEELNKRYDNYQLIIRLKGKGEDSQEEKISIDGYFLYMDSQNPRVEVGDWRKVKDYYKYD